MKRFKNILIDLTGANLQTIDLDRFTHLASQNSARVTLFSSIEEPSLLAKASNGFQKLFEDYSRENKKKLEQSLFQLASEKIPSGLELGIKVAADNPSLAALREINEQGHDLIIIPSQQDEVERHSFVNKIIRKAPCPVWVGHGGGPINSIGACVDPEGITGKGLELNLKSLTMASSLARMESAPLHIFSIWPQLDLKHLNRFVESVEAKRYYRDSQRLAEETVESIISKVDLSDVKIEVELERGDPKVAIPNLVNDYGIKLLVMGNLSRTGIAGYFIGNTAEHVLSKVKCNILTMKYDGFFSPIAA